MAEPLPELVVRDTAAWSDWLARNHDSSPGVLLVLAKKGGATETKLTYDGALEEALCFGWIDGQTGRRDESTFRIRFTPRRSRSVWSQRNVSLATRLAEEGRMREPGLREVERAKADGRWDAAYAGSATIEVPPDLEAALRKNGRAADMFSKLTKQNRYALLYRLHSAKRPETRERRITQFVEMLARGETIYPQKRT